MSVKEDRRKAAKKYTRLKETSSLIETAIKFILFLLFVITGLSRKLEAFLIDIAENKYLVLLIFLFLTGLCLNLLFLPYDYYFGFRLEHRFRLSNQTSAQWFREYIKNTAVGTLLILPVIVAFYWLLSNTSDWWLYTAILISFYSAVITKVAPFVIFPLFYKFTPLEEGELKKRITNMCEKAGFKVSGVYCFNMSKTTRKANAALAGIGKTKRIILADTLIENFTVDEIETVFAHELGHYKKGHILKNVIFSVFLIFFVLWITSVTYDKLLPVFGFSSRSEIAALPLLAVIIGFLSFILSPLSSGLSRKFEFEADRFALTTTRNLDAFISTFNRLADQNLADDEPDRIYEFWFHSHPSIKKRILAAKNFAGKLR